MRKLARVPSISVIVGLVAVSVFLAGFLIERFTQGDVQVTRVEDPAADADKTPDFDGLFRAGVEQLREGHAHAALRTFEEARKHRPGVPEVYVNLGFAYLVLEVPDAARKSFEKAIELRADQPNAYFGLAESFEKLDDLEMALGAMRSYVHLTPEDDPYRRRAMAAVWEWQTALGRNVARADVSDTASDRAVTTDVRAVADANLAERLAGMPLIRLDGGVDRLALYAGKTLILNVWATWCAPCRRELPALQRLSERLDSDRFAVAGLSIDTDPDFVREFLREVGVNYVNYIDVAKDLAGAVADLESVPQTLVIGPDGTLRSRIEGFRDWDDPQIVAQLERRE